MELKRYILLSDGRILTKNEFESQRKVDLFYADRLFVDHSDNILDLVEVGDLVEYKVTDEKRKFEVLFVRKNKIEGFGDYCYFEDVKAIYKRQPNGDYKYYEVK